MFRISLPVLLLAAVCSALDAGAGLLKPVRTFSTDHTVMDWLSFPGAVVAVTPAAVLLPDGPLQLGQGTSVRDLENGFIGLQTHHGQETAFRWLDAEGKMAGQLRERWPYDLPLPRCMVDPRTSTLITTDMLNRIRRFSADGEMVSEQPVFQEYQFHTENTLYTKMIAEKQTVFAGLTQVYPKPGDDPGYRTRLRYFNLAGTTLFTYELDDWQLNAIESRPDGSLHAVSLYQYRPADQSIDQRVLIFDGSGQITHTIAASFRNLFFGGEDQLLLLTKDTAVFYNIPEGSISGIRRLPDPGRIFMTAEYLEGQGNFIIEDGILAQDVNGWCYRDIRLQTIDHTGAVTGASPVSGVVVYQPVLGYDLRSEQLFLGHSSGWMIYQLTNQ